MCRRPRGWIAGCSSVAAPCAAVRCRCAPGQGQVLPDPCASAGAASVLGIAVAVVRVAVADHALDPALFALCTCTSYAAPAIRPNRLEGW